MSVRIIRQGTGRYPVFLFYANSPQARSAQTFKFMKRILLSIIFVLTFLINPETVSGDVLVVDTSAQLTNRQGVEIVDLRKERLATFFKKYNSPLTDYSGQFIYWADRYNIDWRLVPAITGVESTFGKRIPYKSYNAYGWANGNYRFKSWDESIEHVSKTLREKYYDKGATNINKIARRYAPPSNSWSWKVKFFMKKIDSTPVEFDL